MPPDCRKDLAFIQCGFVSSQSYSEILLPKDNTSIKMAEKIFVALCYSNNNAVIGWQNAWVSDINLAKQ